MINVELVIKVPEDLYEAYKGRPPMLGDEGMDMIAQAISNSKLLPKGHGRLGDLDELEQRISSFVEHDADITDEYTVARQRFIVDGIKQTPTIIEADAESDG